MPSREILFVQALLEDEYARQSMCPVILPKLLARLFVLHLDTGTGPTGFACWPSMRDKV